MAPTRQVASAIMAIMERLFKQDNVTHMASVELWVLLTTLLLVVRFVIDFKGPWYGKPGSARKFVILTLETLNPNMVIYTMGLMQLSGARKVNDYFQVWAVLLVTLHYSVKIGRPYTRSKQIPLLDLMSSFWSASLLRVQTFYLLKIPLWAIWSLNAVRIIFLFVSSGKGETSNQESMRLVSDYMGYEDTLSTSTSTSTLDEQEQKKESAMSRYKYLVYGEHRVLKEVQEGSKREGKRTLFSCFRRRRGQEKSESSSSYKIQLDPDGVHKEQLITVETIWMDNNDRRLLGAGEAAGRRKDLCLSFALYKLLRRRFYDLPMHEMNRPAGKEKMRRLVFDILNDRERAFRITGAELSFLQDLFYSKHATVFAGGLLVPLWSLLLSLCVATATGYIAYPARYIPERMDPADRNRITHGVFITRLMVGIIVLKEILEIVLYLWSRWAKVLLLCKYAQLQHCRVMEVAMRWFVLCFGAFSSMLSRPFRFCCQAKLTTVRQQNLLVTVCMPRLGPLFTVRMVSLRGKILGTAGLEDYTKEMIMNELKSLCLEPGKRHSAKPPAVEKGGKSGSEDLENRKEVEIVDNYFPNAFGSNTGVESGDKVEWPCNLREVDTHIILVWHIATSLCEIYCCVLNKKVNNALRAAGRRPQPFLAQQHVEDDGSSKSTRYEHYSTAVTLSNYCVYLVSKALVPDYRLVAEKVLDEVIREIDHVVIDGNRRQREKILRCITLEEVYERLMAVDKPCENPDHHQSKDPSDVEAASTAPVHQKTIDKDLHIGCSLTKMGARLGKNLTKVYESKAQDLWRDLAKFWMGFLLHLAANTGAATHHRHLAGDSELVTHLWALLTHAGYGKAVHFEDLDLDDVLNTEQEMAKSRWNAVHAELGLDQKDVPDNDPENRKS